jgi:hypothetical protein
MCLPQLQIVGVADLDPQGSTFSDGGELGRLVMRESERRHIFVLTREVGESRDHYGDF